MKERISIKCPNCGTVSLYPPNTYCETCGDALPIEEKLEEQKVVAFTPNPPPPPRILPPKFKRKIKYWNNVYTMIGIIFTVFFFWTVLFGIIGYFLWRKGIRDAEAQLRPLEEGIATKGTISNIYQDTSTKINNESPWVVEFTFKHGNTTYTGSDGFIMDYASISKNIGDETWVVYLPEDPDKSALWPPVQ